VLGSGAERRPGWKQKKGKKKMMPQEAFMAVLGEGD
jgi:hypothetical protein